jgi:hypothetical protein
MPSYYYAEAFTEPDTGKVAPGKNTGGGLESGLDSIPPGCKALLVDEGQSPARFVLSLHDSYNTPAPGWVSKTAGEVDTDYPGLLGGV